MERMGKLWRTEALLRSPQTRKDVPVSGPGAALF